MNQFNNHGTSLPHDRLLAYKKSLELLAAVRSAQKALPYAIARGECVEAVAATEIAGEAGDAVAEFVSVVVELGNELYLMLGGLVR